jgi:regulator of replication initiation timing
MWLPPGTLLRAWSQDPASESLPRKKCSPSGLLRDVEWLSEENSRLRSAHRLLWRRVESLQEQLKLVELSQGEQTRSELEHLRDDNDKLYRELDNLSLENARLRKCLARDCPCDTHSGRMPSTP